MEGLAGLLERQNDALESARGEAARAEEKAAVAQRSVVQLMMEAEGSRGRLASVVQELEDSAARAESEAGVRRDQIGSGAGTGSRSSGSVADAKAEGSDTTPLPGVVRRAAEAARRLSAAARAACAEMAARQAEAQALR